MFDFALCLTRACHICVEETRQALIKLGPLLDSRALRDGHFDFGRDRDAMDPKTAVSGRDRSGWDFLGIVSGFFRICLGYDFFFLEILRLLFIMMCSLALT
jgi:hypothetical protein